MEYLKGTNKLSNSDVCSNCHLRLYNKRDELTLGIGNINSSIMFIMPPYDINNDSIIEILSNLYNKAFDRNMLEDVYVTRLIKCFDYSLENDYECVKHCYKYILYEIIRLNIKKVVFLSPDVFNAFVSINSCKKYLNYIKYVTTKNVKSLYYNNNSVEEDIIKNLSIIMNL